MAKQTQSAISAAIVAHREDETTYGTEMVDLPGGIQQGRAKLSAAKIDKHEKGDNQGKQYLYLAGTVVAPAQALKITRRLEGGKIVQVGDPEMMDILGLRTSQFIPLYETANKTVEENVARALNELRKLGLETKHFKHEDEISAALPALVKAGPYFKFNTSESDPTEQYPDPRVWENWLGTQGLENYQPPSGDPVQDNTGSGSVTSDDDVASLGAAADDGDTDAEQKLIAKATEAGIDYDSIETWAEVADQLSESEPEAAEEPETEDEPEEDISWQDRGSMVDDGEDPDNAHEKAMIARCEELGIDYNSIETWAEVGQKLGEAEGAAATETEEPDEPEASPEFVPDKDDIYLYDWDGEECEVKVVKVNKRSKTVDVETTDGEYATEGVSWDELKEG